MRNVITGFAAVAVLIATPAFAETKPGSPAPVAGSDIGPSEKVKDQRYCVEYYVTGSRLPKRSCMTRAEWISQRDFDPLALQK